MMHLPGARAPLSMSVGSAKSPLPAGAGAARAMRSLIVGECVADDLLTLGVQLSKTHGSSVRLRRIDCSDAYSRKRTGLLDDS